MQQLNNELLFDIRSFYADYEIVNNVYSTAYNQKLLIYDLLEFIDLPHIYLHENAFGLWGKLNPSHRAWFINKYILENVTV